VEIWAANAVIYSIGATTMARASNGSAFDPALDLLVARERSPVFSTGMVLTYGVFAVTRARRLTSGARAETV